MSQKNRILIDSITILSASSPEQIIYLEKIFGKKPLNIDELLLEYDDAEFLRYNYDEIILKKFSELEMLLNIIDENKFHNICDLNNDSWNKV